MINSAPVDEAVTTSNAAATLPLAQPQAESPINTEMLIWSDNPIPSRILAAAPQQAETSTVAVVDSARAQFPSAPIQVFDGLDGSPKSGLNLHASSQATGTHVTPDLSVESANASGERPPSQPGMIFDSQGIAYLSGGNRISSTWGEVQVTSASASPEGERTVLEVQPPSESRNVRQRNGSAVHIQMERQAEPVMPAVARALHVDAEIRQSQQSSNINSHNTAQTLPHQVSGALSTSLPAVLNGAPDNLAQQLQSASAAVDDERFAAQVSRGLASMVQQRGGTMTMRLDPPELGELRVQVTMARGVVSAAFAASSPQAHQLLQENMATLRAALESHGVTVDRLTVHTPQSASGQHSFRDDPNMNPQARHHQDAAGGESRGRRDNAPPESPREYPESEFANLITDVVHAMKR